MADICGVIYIMTNPAIPGYVKFGYTKDVEGRRKELSNSSVPYSFRLYATYDVECSLCDKDLYDLIDTLNPELRATEEDDRGRMRAKEFYAISAEDAYKILESIAKMHGFAETRLKKYEITASEMRDEEIAKEVVRRRVNENFRFSLCEIQPGQQIAFRGKEGNPNNGKQFTVDDEKHVLYNGERWSLSALGRELGGIYEWGAGNFEYNGENLNNIRARLGNII